MVAKHKREATGSAKDARRAKDSVLFLRVFRVLHGQLTWLGLALRPWAALGAPAVNRTLPGADVQN